MFAEHPTSGLEIKIIGPLHRLWCFLFGPIYYLSKGSWNWALISFFTVNGLLIGFPLCNRAILKSYYENTGWRVYE